MAMGAERRVPTIEILVTIFGYPGASMLTESTIETEIALLAIETRCTKLGETTICDNM